MRILVLFCFLVILNSCKSDMEPLKTVENVDLERYLGTWYEITRLPNRFEKGLICVTAEYSLREDGKIKVTNKGHKEENPEEISTAIGKAWQPDPNETGRLKVQFFWPFSGKYYIFHLDKENYNYALVGDPSRKYFWILSRQPQIENTLYNELVSIADENGFDSSKFYKTPQDCH